jgi:hypothetical protein
MPKSKWRPSVCKGCGLTVDQGVPVSKNGWCPDCGLAAALVAAVQMAEREGPVWEEWCRKMAADVIPRRHQGVGGRFFYDPLPENPCGTTDLEDSA